MWVDMIIRIILNNFFKKYYMNKKIIHLITHKLPIVSVIILILAYVYLSIPENYTLQIGGMAVATTTPLPKNTPWVYKYRWVFVAVPILIIFFIIYIQLTLSGISRLTMWDFGKDFFSEFKIQVNNAIKSDPPYVESADPKNFKYSNLQALPSDAPPDIKKLFNILQLTSDPSSGLYKESQYFCGTHRACSCCADPKYTAFFKGMVSKCAAINASDKTIAETKPKE